MKSTPESVLLVSLEKSRSQLGTSYIGKALKISFLARNELAHNSFPA